MKVTLGPASCDPENYGSTAGGSHKVTTAVNKLNKEDGEYSWIRGHLLNDNMGGDGHEVRNLTPLTSAANSEHKTYEGKIKDGITKCRQYHDLHKSDDYWYGIEYTVTVSTEPYQKTKPYNLAPEHISVTAKAAKKKKDGTGDIVILRRSMSNPVGFYTLTRKIYNK
ncbi:MAG: hypothetical protein G8345_22215 [Magnetococcales bacterium]|nr:hypothetical protein [Magnetococcales bacterium]